MTRLTVADCRKLIPGENEFPHGDEDIGGLRDMLYALAEIVSDAFNGLETVDQTLFDPPGDVIQQLNEGSFRPAPKRGKVDAS